MSQYRGTEIITGDGRSTHVKHWTKWLAQLPSIRRKFSKWPVDMDFDPMCFNETASVALLANAATKAGYLALTEYVLLKRHLTRGRPYRNGRCDLWIADGDSKISWAFEFKQRSASSRMKEDTFAKTLAQAQRDAAQLGKDEADHRVGCLILCPKIAENPSNDLTDHFDNLCRKADFSFRVGQGHKSIWLAFKLVE